MSFKSWQIRILILCWCAYACIYFGRVNLSVAIPELQDFLNVSKTRIGIIGSLSFWVYGIGQLINGYIGDKVSSRLYIFIGLFMTALANILFGFSASLLVMCVLWAINGFFQSMLWGPMAKTVSLWIPPRKRSSAAIGISTSMIGGFLLAWGLSGQILRLLNWKWIFWIPGIFILIFSFIWYKYLRNRPEDAGFKPVDEGLTDVVSAGPAEIEPSDKVISGQNEDFSFRYIIKKSKLWFVAIACFAQGIVKDSIMLWAPTFFIERYAIDIQATSALIIAIPALNFGGMMLAGRLNKTLKYRERNTTIVMFVAGIFMIGGLITLGSTNALIGLVFLGLSSAMMYGANTMLLGVFPMRFAKYGKVSSVAGFLDFCSYMAAGLAAFATGIIVDLSGWGGVLIFWVAVSGIGAVALLVSRLYDVRAAYTALKAGSVQKEMI